MFYHISSAVISVFIVRILVVSEYFSYFLIDRLIETKLFVCWLWNIFI